MAEPHCRPEQETPERRRIVEIRLSEREFAVLEGLSAYHRKPIGELLCGGLPRIIEKYQVLRRLGERETAGPSGRRRFVTGSSPNRHHIAALRSQAEKEE